MTQADLDALPEIGGIGYRDNGNGTRTPYMREDFALWQEDTEPMWIVDCQGITWTVGMVNGQRCKRKIVGPLL